MKACLNKDKIKKEQVKIVSIGSGNLASQLSIALQNEGFEIAQVYSRTETSAKSLADVLNVPYTADLDCIIRDASLYMVAVSDDAIETLLDGLSFIEGLVIHTAGSVPIDVFAGKLKNYGVLYPLQTFSKSRRVNFSDVPIFIEANTSANLQFLQTVAESISKNVYPCSSAMRLQLHLAAVFGCNFVNHLYHISSQLAMRAGFDFTVLTPLLLETTHKAIISKSPKDVQTGPAVRNDRKVMDKHLELLASNPEWKEIYELLSENIKIMNNEQ
jgi:predicted short-subunit dehydrogenase-like oxidoreductase (DUF2520 family)